MDTVRLCAVILAAGLSRRMGADKLLLPYGGQPLGEYILQSAARNAAWFEEVLVVGRHAETQELARRYGFRSVHNPEPERGMGHSLALGVSASGPWDGCLIALADMPDLRDGTIHTLCERFSRSPDRIAVPVFGGRRGNPVLFPSRLRRSLEQLDGDQGGRALLQHEQDSLLRVQVYDPGILRDIDTPDALRRIE